MMPNPLFFIKAEMEQVGDQAKLRGSFDRPARMREYGNVNIPQEAFIAALRMGTMPDCDLEAHQDIIES